MSCHQRPSTMVLQVDNTVVTAPVIRDLGTNGGLVRGHQVAGAPRPPLFPPPLMSPDIARFLKADLWEDRKERQKRVCGVGPQGMRGCPRAPGAGRGHQSEGEGPENGRGGCFLHEFRPLHFCRRPAQGPVLARRCDRQDRTVAWGLPALRLFELWPLPGPPACREAPG